MPPVETRNARTDYEREGSTERDSAEDGEITESHEGTHAYPRTQGSDGGQRPREVKTGQPKGERSEQEFGHLPMVPSLQAQRFWEARGPTRRPQICPPC
jgi:hypothetical protein